MSLEKKQEISKEEKNRILSSFRKAEDKIDKINFYLTYPENDSRQRVEIYIAESDNTYSLRLRIIHKGDLLTIQSYKVLMDEDVEEISINPLKVKNDYVLLEGFIEYIDEQVDQKTYEIVKKNSCIKKFRDKTCRLSKKKRSKDFQS